MTLEQKRERHRRWYQKAERGTPVAEIAKKDGVHYMTVWKAVERLRNLRKWLEHEAA